jgi:hypothetical protein
MLPATTTRASKAGSPAATMSIRDRTWRSVHYHAERPHEIAGRLRALDEEWDVERTLEANASTLTLVGLALALLVDRRWIALPIAVQSFLLQHALQGWCPPLPILRRLGVRTAAEIAHERYALMALRGDFDGMRKEGGPDLQARRAFESTRH